LKEISALEPQERVSSTEMLTKSEPARMLHGEVGNLPADQDDLKEISALEPQERVSSTEMLTKSEPARMLHGEVGNLPPDQCKVSDKQKTAMQHDKRRKQASTADRWAAQIPAPSPIEGLNQEIFNLPALETAVQKTPDIMSIRASKNPFHHSQTSKNPFVQSYHDSGPTDLHQYPHPIRSETYPSADLTYHSHSQTMSRPNSGQQQHRMFPAIQSSSGQFNTTHVGHDQNSVDSSYHVTNSNSGNTTTTITANSNNDSSIRVGIDELPQSLELQQYMYNIKMGKSVPVPSFAWHGNKYGSKKLP
jgi:hypothetical protein